MLSQNAWDMVLFNPLALFLLIIGFVFFFQLSWLLRHGSGESDRRMTRRTGGSNIPRGWP
jgi:hypothetical protein